MIVRTRTAADSRRPQPLAPRPAFRRKAMCQLIALALFGGGAAAQAATPQAFSPAWFATRQQPGVTAPTQPTGSSAANVSFTPGSALLQKRVQQSITNLNTAASALAAQMQAQKDAQAAAAQLVANVPDGLGAGGLRPAAGVATDPTLWQNALKPTDAVAASGKHTVEVRQTAKKAILTWDSFNVGRDTTLYFNQSAGNLSGGGNDWIALNRVNDPTAAPSRILGSMKAEGTVYVLNRNGVIFGQGAQVNTRSLLASSMGLFSDDLKTSNDLFLTSGIADPARSGQTILTAGMSPGGDVAVDKGAMIATLADGYVLLAAPRVTNRGAVVADDGQAVLASAGGRGRLVSRSSDGQLDLLPTVQDPVPDPAFGVANTGLIQARRGAVTIFGPTVAQDGVVVASTSIARAGKIDIRGQVDTTGGPVGFGQGSVTAILPEKDGTTTTSSPDADKVFVPGSLTVSGSTITLDKASLLEVPGGAVSLTASKFGDTPNSGRIYIDSGATIDVSGLADVELPVSALLVSIPRIGQNELADSPLLRNSFLYTQKNVSIDGTVSGTRADGLDWIGSPILNARGYVQNVPRDIEQMLTRGGSITLDGSDVIARTGSRLALDGGYLAYQSGWITTPNLLGADGRIYNIASADPDVDYVGFAGQYTSTHARWGVSETYNSPLLGGTRRYQEGFVKGADAGKLTIHADRQLALDGEITAQATPGTQQTADGDQPVGGRFDFDLIVSGQTTQPYPGLRIQQTSRTLESLTPGFDRDTVWSDVDVATGLDGPWLTVGADTLGKAGFSSLSLKAVTDIVEGTTLAVRPGGSVAILGGRIDVHGSIDAPAGTILLGTASSTATTAGAGGVPSEDADITLYAGSQLNARGQWINDTGQVGTNVQGSRWIDGGKITLNAYEGATAENNDATGSIRMLAGSRIDVSGGGYVDTRGTVRTAYGVPVGRGGDVSVAVYAERAAGSDFGAVWGQNLPPPEALDHAHIVLDGTIAANGFSGGGALSLRAVQIQVGGDPADMALSNGLWLPAAFFANQGFSRYNLNGVTDATVAEGEHVMVRPMNFIGDLDALRTLGSGADLHATPAVGGVGVLDDWQRWQSRGLTQDTAPGFTLRAGDYIGWNIYGNETGRPPQSLSLPGVTGSATIGKGATVDVDAGGVIDVSAFQDIDVDGGLTARGGTLSLETLLPRVSYTAPSWIRVGSGASLDASGISLIDTHAAAANTATGRTVPRTGDLLAGGSIALSGTEGAFVVADNGARIDVSGTSDVFDLTAASRRLNGTTQEVTPTAVWSDAGSILFAGSAGLYMGATLEGHGGSPSARGGSVQVVALDADIPSVPVQAEGILVRQSLGDRPDFALPTASGYGMADGTLTFAADVLDGSGIDTFQLGMTPGKPVGQQRILPVAFAGDVNLALGRALTINASGYEALAGTATSVRPTPGYVQGAGRVSITAPYVHLAGTSSSPVAAAGDGILDVRAAAIDMGGIINLQGWRQAAFDATDDLRFTLPSTIATNGTSVMPGMLFSTGDLAFSAGQIYPSTGYRFAIDANASGLADADGHVRETHITFLPATGASTTPLSAGGALLISADHIEQQGVIRVPSGSIVLGTTAPATDAADFGLVAGLPALARTRSVHLAPGSITSVSLDGLTVPYGNTIDGVDWRYALREASSAPVVSAPPVKQVSVHGDSVALDAGATIDLDGGGRLQASEFVPGTGGTRDLLATAPDGATAYAILPGYNGALGATDLAMDASGVSQPGIGRQVYLSGVPGLAAGNYTLLPAQYANLPGALRIYQDTTSRDAIVGRSARFADGGYAVAGYYADAFTGARDARTTTFVVQSAPVWGQYSQYRLTDADTFFSAAAARKGEVAPPLSADAGRLQIGAGRQLALGAMLHATPGKGGRTSQVDIAGEAIQVLGADGTAREGYLGIAADGLTGLGAGSLLLGGTRRSDSDGDHVDVTAGGILLSNDAAHPLAGQEILLVASAGGDGIALEDGSVLAARGYGNPVASQPLVFGSDAGIDAQGVTVPAVDGDGALLRVSQNGAAPVSRFGLGNAAPGGQLSIGAGATVAGGNALTLDATGRVRVDDNASLSGKAIDATANRIAFVGAGATAPDEGLAIGAATLAQWSDSDAVSLRSRGSIDFLGAQDIALQHALTLSAGALSGDGHDVTVQAATVTLANALGAAAGDALGGGGTLAIRAGEIDLGQGTLVLHGFGGFDGTATSGIVATASGALDFGSAAVDLSAPVLVVDGGAGTTLSTTGAMRLHGAAGTALSRDGLGGSLTLRAASIDDGMNLTAAAGGIHLDATQGGIHIASGTHLDVGGVTRQFFDTAAYAPGGSLELDATGDIAVDPGATLRYGGATQAGDAGSFHAVAGGSLVLGGNVDGHAASGYRGGYFTVGSGGALDLDALSGLVAASGSTGLVDITSGQGDLVLSTGRLLKSQKVFLYADGGKARIDGTVDASAPAASRIEVWGRQGVDIDGTLDAHVTTPEQRGGDVVLGTSGSTDGGLNPMYGYEDVQRDDAGYVHVGAGARIDVSGGASTAFAGGKVSVRAPLLADGDVPVTVANAGAIDGARDVTIEPYATWSTRDVSGGAQHFDGVIDPSGWYANGGDAMVAGSWVDAKGNALPAPADAAQRAIYLSQYYFTPDAVNTDHAGFYGYVDGDATKGPGTLMGFVEAPGFTFGDRFANIDHLHVRPGVELRNPAEGPDSGDIRVLTNWNLGAGTTDENGKPRLAYRYNGEAPILTVRAAGNVDVKASITDGFFQSNTGAALNDPPADGGGDSQDDPAYDAALSAYRTTQAYLDANNAWNGSINLADGDPIDFKTPGGGVADISKDPFYQPLTAPAKNQVDDYYVNYQRYIGEYGDGDTNFNWAAAFVATNSGSGFLVYNPTQLQAPQPAAFTSYADYASNYEAWLETNFGFGLNGETPSPLLLPIDADYGAWSANYGTYITGHQTYYYYVNGVVGDPFGGSQLFYAPFAPRESAKTSNPAYDAALSAYQKTQAYLDANGAWNGSINLADGDPIDFKTPGGGQADISKDPYYQPLTAPAKRQTDQYYTNYTRYIGEYGDGDTNFNWAAAFVATNSGSGFLAYKPTQLQAPQPAAFTSYADYASNYEAWLEGNFGFGLNGETPSPLLSPIDADYGAWSADYGTYITGHQTYYYYVNGVVGDPFGGSQLFYAPFAPREDADNSTKPAIPFGKPAADNSPSNMPTFGNAASLASATLIGGPSTTYRIVAGSDLGALDPLATQGGSAAGVRLDGHFAVKDLVTDPAVVTPNGAFSGKTLLMPTTIRTGTGDIDITAAGDIRWLDAASPATIYTAGVPTDGTRAGTDIGVVRPAERSNDALDTLPDLLVNGPVNPEHSGDVRLRAGGDIDAIQRVVDIDGSQTKGSPGTPVAQYWWQWMQTGNAADGSRSSINFANFHQGVMSAGGNVDVDAGGDITELFVSLPTTWYKNADGQSVTTVGGGDLAVHAGGNILSGGYFVARGTAGVHADGGIGASPGLARVIVPERFTGGSVVSAPVSTIFALQDARFTVGARGSIDVGGVYDPSYYRSQIVNALAPAGHVDSQGYSTNSSFSAASSAGNLVFGSMFSSGWIFGADGAAGPLLPATVGLTALDGNITVRTNGELFPSPVGNLSLLAGGNVTFDRRTSDGGLTFGLIDSSPDAMPSPLAPIGLDAGQTSWLRQPDYVDPQRNLPYHEPVALHADDAIPVRIYALTGDIVNGEASANGFYLNLLQLLPSKQANIFAGRDVVNVFLAGQHTRRDDVTRVSAGRDVYDTPYPTGGNFILPNTWSTLTAPYLALGGPGTFVVDAGRDIGPFVSQADVSNLATQGHSYPTGIQTVGNAFNPYLPHESADILVNFGIAPGVDASGFVAHYLDGDDGLPGLLPDLVAFMQRRLAGTKTATGLASDDITAPLSSAEARALFAQEPETVQRIFAETSLFKLLAQVGTDYNDATSPYKGQYARGYAAVESLFPHARGYTANGTGQGGLNGAASTVNTGDLDIRSSTIQTQQGGDVTVLGPGGQALIGSTAAPAQIADANGNVLAGPNSMGLLTLEAGNVNVLTDRSLLLAQSRVFTEQGGDVTIWSSNGDINAGQGAKTSSELPPPTFLCDVDAWCQLDARGQVSGAGIATLQTVEGAPSGSAYLIAPRGTVDAGDAGIRVSGNLVIAAARVANADNIQVKGDTAGVPVTAAVNVGALNAASAAATAASQAAEDVARKQQSDARDKLPSEISVRVLRDGDSTSSVAPSSAYDSGSAVQVLGTNDMHGKLTEAERDAMRHM